jgi:hypothetical protein
LVQRRKIHPYYNHISFHPVVSSENNHTTISCYFHDFG